MLRFFKANRRIKLPLIAEAYFTLRIVFGLERILEINISKVNGKSFKDYYYTNKKIILKNQ
ncbi:uncharacterized protein EAF01_010032 [Botrytis porri]|uniref:uncharacterized protein n=1 Tax=Botrytis porri TaxID=87229 RepID=UPI001901C8DD|nr:uncharacterized protein EAF01_010032 [Botrytis porri]KAF7894581.1 hypothetical protein EAF01_010032 [Botrytis porri]